MRKSKAADKNPNMVIEILKTALIASALSIVLIVILALLLKVQVFSSESIPLCNAVIKVISEAAAAVLVMRKCTHRRWLYGGIVGLAHALLALIVFAILSDTFAFSVAVLSGLGMGFLAGMLASMIVQAVK